jgi:hypothetical protein
MENGICLYYPASSWDWYLRRDERVLKTLSNKTVKNIIYWLLITLIYYFSLMGGKQSFIYFQF